MTAKRKDAPVFAKMYVDGLQRVRDGKAVSHSDPFAPGGAAFKTIMAARLTLLTRPHEAASAAVGTELWYCRAIALLADYLEAAVKANRTSEMVREAFALGAVIREWTIQKRHGGAIDLHSEHSNRIRSEAAKNKQRGEQRAKAWQTEANRIWAKNGSLSENRVAQMMANAGLGKQRTIRNAIHKPEKKLA